MLFRPLVFTFLLLFSNEVLADHFANKTFKEVKEHLSQFESKKALYLLRNRAPEMVGMDLELSKFAQGVLGTDLKDYKEALKQLNQIEGLEELSTYISLYKAKAYYGAGDFASSFKFLKEAQKDKSFPRQLKEDLSLLEADLLYSLKKTRAAEKLLLKNLKSFSKVSRKQIYSKLLVRTVPNKKGYCSWFKKAYLKHFDLSIAKNWNFNDDSLKIGRKKLNCSISLKTKRSRLVNLFRAGRKKQAEKDLKTLPSSYFKSQLMMSYHYLDGDIEKAIQVAESFKGLKKEYYHSLRSIKYYLNAGKFKKVTSIYKALLARESQKARQVSLLYKYGRFNLSMGRLNEAEDSFKKLLAFGKNKNHIVASRFYLAFSQFLNEKYEEAYGGFHKLVDSYSKSDKRYKNLSLEQLHYWSARALEKSGQIDKAALVYKALAGESFSRYYGILGALRLESFAKQNRSLLSFEDFIALPWIKKDKSLAYKKKDFLNKLKLSSRMPSSLWVGANKNGIAAVDLRSHYETPELELEFSKEEKDFEPSLSRFIYFSRIGFYKEAARELKSVDRQTRDFKLKLRLFKYFKSIQDYKGLSLAASTSFYLSRPRKKGEDKDLWEKAYPVPYAKQIEDHSQGFDVPKSSVLSIMRAESYFNPNATSYVGAVGLLQLMPRTAQKVNASLSEPRRQNLENIELKLKKPEVNILLGSKYIERLEKLSDARMPYLAASYNAGPHRLNFWTKIHSKRSLDEFIELIPFSETRSYVKKTTHNKYVYDSLYKESQEPSPDLAYLIQPLDYVYAGALPIQENW